MQDLCSPDCARRVERLDEAADAHPGVAELREARARVAVALATLRRSLLEYQHGPIAAAPPERADAWAGYVSSAGWDS